MHIVLFVIGGLIWGSFLSVVMSRLDDPKSIFIGRSRCPKCKRKLKALDLIPVVSFLLLRGKCRYCKKPIGYEYLILELLCAAVALLTFYLEGLSLGAAFLFISLSSLAAASLEDVLDQEVDLFFFITGITSALLYIFLKNYSFYDTFLGAITFAAIPFTLYAISREKWMGLGDSLFAFWAGVLVGFPVSLLMIFAAFLLGALFGIIKMLAQPSSSSRLAFGPFLAVSAIVGLAGKTVFLNYLEFFF